MAVVRLVLLLFALGCGALWLRCRLWQGLVARLMPCPRARLQATHTV